MVRLLRSGQLDEVELLELDADRSRPLEKMQQKRERENTLVYKNTHPSLHRKLYELDFILVQCRKRFLDDCILHLLHRLAAIK